MHLTTIVITFSMQLDEGHVTDGELADALEESEDALDRVGKVGAFTVTHNGETHLMGSKANRT